jgi:hypothetical protein
MVCIFESTLETRDHAFERDGGALRGGVLSLETCGQSENVAELR